MTEKKRVEEAEKLRLDKGGHKYRDQGLDEGGKRFNERVDQGLDEEGEQSLIRKKNKIR